MKTTATRNPNLSSNYQPAPCPAFGVHPSGCQDAPNTLKRGHRAGVDFPNAHRRKFLIGFASAVLPIAITFASAADQSPSAPVVVDPGSSRRLWMRTAQQVLPSGKIQSRNSFTCELATGIHFKQATQDGGGEWAESKELIEPAPNGAVARFGQIRATFAANINTPGAIQVQTENGEMFTINPTGLAYTDVRTGGNVLIASVQDSVGEILPPNRIIYRNFLDSVLADLVVTYTRFGVESDIHLLENLPPPEQYGPDFHSETARLEAYTEFVSPPAPSVNPQVLDSAIVLDPQQPAAF